MPVYKDKKRGTWYFKFSKTVNGKTHQILKRGFETKMAATVAELKAQDQLENSKDKNKRITMDELFALFLSYQESKVKVTTIEVYQKIYDCHIQAEFGSFLAFSLTHEDLFNWKRRVVIKAFGERYTNSIIALMRSIITLGIRKNIISDNSLLDELERVKLNQIKKTSERQVLTLNQIQIFLNSFEKTIEKEYSYYLYFLGLAYSGMRPNEYRCLQVKDIDGDYLCVNKSITSKLGSDDIIQTPKNKSSNRKVLMPHDIIVLLQEYTKDYDPDDFIFGKEKTFRETNIRRELNKHIAFCKLPPIVIYSFRHSHATNLIKAGVSIKVVSKRLGHATTSTTMNVYWHLFKDDEKQVLNILNKIKNEDI